MITLLQRQLVPVMKYQTGIRASQRPALTPSNRKTDFQKLIQPAIASAPASPVAKTNGTSSIGAANYTNAASQPAADGAGAPASTPIPIPPITDVHDRTQVEAHMNAWLQNVQQRGNDQKTQVYQQAMTDWKTNNDRYLALGLPTPPPPTPPTVDPVQAMPSGWWFLT